MKEMPEEEAKEYALKKRSIKIMSNREFDLCQNDFIAGANWQSERMFSEEEVLRIITELKSYLSFGDEFNEIEWVSQFKKQK